MSTLELIKTQNDHKANTFFENGEDAKSSLKQKYEETETPKMVANPRDYIRQTTDYKALWDALLGKMKKEIMEQ